MISVYHPDRLRELALRWRMIGNASRKLVTDPVLDTLAVELLTKTEVIERLVKAHID